MEEMKFSETIDKLLDGNQIHRKSWTDTGVFISIRDEQLKIYNPSDKSVRPLILSTGDMMGEDWVIM